MQLLEQLKKLHKEVDEKFPEQYVDAGFGVVGLILTDELENFGYDETPKNSLAFAHTGMDGIHYSFLTKKDVVTDNSPIVMTIPMAEHANYIVGADLRDFLCLGCRYGYSLLVNVDCDRNGTLEKCSSPNESNDERNNAILQFLADSLDLKPWENAAEHFENLQSKYGPSIIANSDF